MFNIGMPELVLVFVVALLVFGPRKLPELSRLLGRAMREFRKAADDFRDAVQNVHPSERGKEAEPQPQPPGPPAGGGDGLRG